MPQMKPLMWMIQYLFLIIMMMFYMMINYFNNSNKIYFKTKINLKKIILWKW
uniref:ATP synthase F0 subunit 8 n=1 Tax=Acerella muscorum TaxID=187596 RepID=A0A0C4K4J5_9HEXA|nr:ATP synthase F0 subunit 8 [Acerella muscorum]AHL42968.1 ATP synthase F0 subunit 8 [Acerella muscorum]